MAKIKSTKQFKEQVDAAFATMQTRDEAKACYEFQREVAEHEPLRGRHPRHRGRHQVRAGRRQQGRRREQARPGQSRQRRNEDEVNLKSSVESLTPRCREAESAEKVPRIQEE